MGLSWINPIYLGGVLLLALPVLIHLVHKHHPSGFRFPSLMFLQQIPLQQKRRLEIRHWLLLLLRCLLILLILAAFARPFFSSEQATDAIAGESRDSIILLDRSYSMRLGQRWQQARERALSIIGQRRTGDRIGIVLFDDESEVISELSEDGGNLRGLIERQAPGVRGTRLRLALEQAARLLDASNAAQKRVYLISDFSAANEATPRIAADIEIIPQRLDITQAANAAIASFQLMPSARAAADEFALSVDLVNHGDSPVQRWLDLSLNGRQVERREIELAAGQTRRVQFDQLTVSGDLARGLLQLDDDALMLDNRAHFVYSSRRQVPLLLLEPTDARSNQSVHLQQALKLSRRPVFRVSRTTLEELQPQDLSAYAVLVINDSRLPGGAQGRALRDFVAAGGGLLLAIGDRLEGSWPSDDTGYAPGRLRQQRDAEPGRAFRITGLDAPLRDSDLRRAQIFSYRELEPQSGERVLARYDNGAAALLERRLGDGRVLALTTTLDPHWNDLALKPNFLPFFHSALRYLTTFEAYPNSVRIGEVVDVMRYARALAGGDAVVAAADDSSLTIEFPGQGERRLQRDNPLLAIEAPGFYQIHRATPAAVEVVLAANIDSAESIPRQLDVERFVGDIRASALTTASSNLLTERQADSFERQQQWWYVILSLALALMLVEAFGANWTAGRRSLRN